MRTAIDTNVLSALWGGEASARRISPFLFAAAGAGGLVIHPVVYVEARAHPDATEGIVNDFLEKTRIVVDWNIGQPIWLLAAERFEQYVRRRRRQGVAEAKRFAADFLVAAHALLCADRLVTFDQRSYGADFPELRLVQP